MKKATRISIIAGLIISSLAMVFVFQTTKKSYNNLSPEFYLKSKELFEAYVADEINADSLYFDKVIEIRGKVISTVSENKVHTITLEGTETGNVICNFIKKPQGKLPEDGTEIMIIGVCGGFSNDVILNQCALAE